MSWHGKVLGGAVGWAIGGPIGALLGATLGHQLDKAGKGGEGDARAHRAKLNAQERKQLAFFTATFTVLGHIAKADGKVCDREIDFASRLMSEMKLDSKRRRFARELFRRGKSANFPIDAVLSQLRSECRGNIEMFMRILVHAAYINGELKPEELSVLEHVCLRLGVSAEKLEQMETAARNETLFANKNRGGAAQMELHDAYLMLGVPQSATKDELKNAYRRMMNRHHPDKLVAKGMPKEMVRIATERTQEIRLAYDKIKQARGYA